MKQFSITWPKAHLADLADFHHLVAILENSREVSDIKAEFFFAQVGLYWRA